MLGKHLLLLCSGKGGGTRPRTWQEAELADESLLVRDSIQHGAHLHNGLLPGSGHL